MRYVYGTGKSGGFKWDVYRMWLGLQVNHKCSKKLSQSQKSMTNSLRRKNSEQETANLPSFVQPLQKSLRCDLMDVDIDSVINEELERIEDQENQVSNDSGAEKASA